jgi:HipA-like protein
MRKAEIYRNGISAGTLTETDSGVYIFTYDTLYFNDKSKPELA